jgi:biotin carboxyl carrier protein
MKYAVDFGDGNPVDVDVTVLPSGKLAVSVGGKPVDVDVATLRMSRPVAKTADGARSLGSQLLSLRIDGKVVDLTTEGSPPELGVVAGGKRTYVRVVSERQRAAESARRSGKGGAERTLKSPMPGRVIKVMVEAGATVAAGQALMVVEAMKMENDVKAKAAGVVETLHVKVGDTVEAGAKLVTFQAS